MESAPVISRGDLTKKGAVVSEDSSSKTLKIMSEDGKWHAHYMYLGSIPLTGPLLPETQRDIYKSYKRDFQMGCHDKKIWYGGENE